MTSAAPVYFTDENTLGLGKLLRRHGRDDVVHPGHEDLPEVPVGTLDLDWMPAIAERGLIVITRDRRIRTRPAELRGYWEHGIRSVWIGAKQDLGPRDQLALFLEHEERLRREILKRGAGPWTLAMSPSGVRPLRLREPRRWGTGRPDATSYRHGDSSGRGRPRRPGGARRERLQRRTGRRLR